MSLNLLLWEARLDDKHSLELHGVQDRASELRFGIFQMRQCEAGDPAQAVALVLPGYCGLHQIYLLVNQSHRHPWKSGGDHLNGKLKCKCAEDWHLSVWRPTLKLVTSSSCWMKECMGDSGLGGRDTCMCRSSPEASVSRQRTNATLSWSRLDSSKHMFDFN